MRYLISLGLLALNCTLYAQYDEKIDSLKFLLDQNDLSKAERLEVYYSITLASKSPAEKLKFAQDLLQYAIELNNKEYEIKAKLRIGTAYRYMGNLGDAFNYLFEAANSAVRSPSFESDLLGIYLELATCYTQNGDTRNALVYETKAIKILRKSGNKATLGLALLNTGYDFYLTEQYDSALSYYNESEPILFDQQHQLGLAYITGNRALVYWKLGDFQKAKEDLFQAIEMLKPLGDRYAMADYLIQLGNIFYEENNQEMSVSYAKSGLKIAKEEGLKEQVRDASYLLFNLYQNDRNFEIAVDYLMQYHTAKDSIQNLETNQKLASLQTEFEVGQKQAEVDFLLEQRRSNQIIMVIGGILLLLAIVLVIIVYYYFRSKTKLSKQLQEQKEDLIRLNSTKDKFFSIISHDLRGPMGSLIGLLSIANYVVDNDNNGQLKEMLDKMKISAERLSKLLDNLLNWALQQKGHFSYTPEKVKVSELLEDSLEVFSDMASSKRIELTHDLEQDFALYVDKNSTSTIFRNLINNAIKFTDKGGKVSITTVKNANGHKDMGLISIQDSGIGMSPDKLEKIATLDPKISSKGTAGEVGLGLGLQLVYEFAKLNHGSIEVNSEVGVGSDFKVFLPLN